MNVDWHSDLVALSIRGSGGGRRAASGLKTTMIIVPITHARQPHEHPALPRMEHLCTSLALDSGRRWQVSATPHTPPPCATIYMLYHTHVTRSRSVHKGQGNHLTPGRPARTPGALVRRARSCQICLASTLPVVVKPVPPKPGSTCRDRRTQKRTHARAHADDEGASSTLAMSQSS
jgi:hypothetical protein